MPLVPSALIDTMPLKVSVVAPLVAVMSPPLVPSVMGVFVPSNCTFSADPLEYAKAVVAVNVPMVPAGRALPMVSATWFAFCETV